MGSLPGVRLNESVRCSKYFTIIRQLGGLPPLNWRGSTTRGGACGLIGVNARNLTGGDSRMMARLTTLPDALRGGAWPSPVRVVKCPVKSGKPLSVGAS